METMVKIEDKKDVDKMKEFLKTITEEEQQLAYFVIQGARIGARSVQKQEKEPA